MPDFLKSIHEWFRQKTANPVWLVFIVTSIIWNWRIVSTYFFEEYSVLGSTKAEYIDKNLLFHVAFFGNSFFDLLFTFIANKFFVFGIPVFVTWLIIFKLQNILNLAHRESLKSYFSRKKEFLNQQKEFIEYELSFQKDKVELLRQETEVAVKTAEYQSDLPEQSRWELEYKSADKEPDFESLFAALESIIYKERGVYQSNNAASSTYISAGQLALADAYGLISFSIEDEYVSKISLTEKGRFFLKKWKSRFFF